MKFFQNRGKCINFLKISGKLEIKSERLERSSGILSDRNTSFFQKMVKVGKFFGNRGNLKQVGKCFIAFGGWTPLHPCKLYLLIILQLCIFKSLKELILLTLSSL